MADLLAQYEEYLAAEKHASQNTLSSYMRDLHQFAVYLDEFHPMPLPQVTQEVISGYVAWMGGKGKSAGDDHALHRVDQVALHLPPDDRRGQREPGQGRCRGEGGAQVPRDPHGQRGRALP